MKVVIDRNTWIRGQSGFRTFLLRPRDMHRTALGFVCKAAGLTDNQLEFKSRPADVTSDEGRYCWEPVDGFIHALTHHQRSASGGFTTDTSLSARAMAVNDNSNISDNTRESWLIIHGAKVGIEFEFISGVST